MSPEEKKKLQDSFRKAVDARPDADKHFPHRWYDPCETVRQHYEKVLAGEEIYAGVDKALAHIREWKEQDKKNKGPEL